MLVNVKTVTNTKFQVDIEPSMKVRAAGLV